MTELDEFDSNLNAELDKLQKKNSFFKQKGIQSKKCCNKKMSSSSQSISTLIESYELKISNLDKVQSAKYNNQLRSINKRVYRLRSELELKKMKGRHKRISFKEEQNNKLKYQQIISY